MQRIYFIIFLAVIWVSGNTQTPYDSTNLNGVWLYNSVNTSTDNLNTISNAPFKVTGTGLYVKWSALEPSDNVYNWLWLDTLMQRAVDRNLKINLMVWVGPFSPEWIYRAPHNIDSVITNDPRNTFQKYPYYFHPQYKVLWYRMLDSVFNHIAGLPENIRNNIKIFQSAQGTTGDFDPYKGLPVNLPETQSTCNCSSYIIGDTAWIGFVKNEWKRSNNNLKTLLPNINHLVNVGTDKIVQNKFFEEAFLWTRSNLPNVMYKANNMGHWYQMNSEALSRQVYDSILNVTENGLPKTRARDEFDIAQNNAELMKPAWHKYFTAINALYFGVDMWNVFSNDLLDTNARMVYNFYNKYAGIKCAANAKGGFIILRDGLDAADTNRFPEYLFGTGTITTSDSSGAERCKRIARSFAKNGATQLDAASGQGDSFNQVSAEDINDVGWNIFPGNYEKFVYQYNPNTTSVGYWQQGDTTQPYGRFARGFEHATSKDTMFFNVDDQFTINGNVSIRVVYLDKGNSGFKVMYANTNNELVTANSYTTQNTNKWMDEIITLNNAVFNNRCPNNTDIMLINTGTGDTIFHMIEISKN